MSDVTRVFTQIESGDPTAAEQLLPLVYDELRKLGFGSFAVRDEQGLCILDLQAGEARQILAGQMTMPRWSADGKRMVVDNRRNKKLIVIETKELVLAD